MNMLSPFAFSWRARHFLALVAALYAGSHVDAQERWAREIWRDINVKTVEEMIEHPRLYDGSSITRSTGSRVESSDPRSAYRVRGKIVAPVDGVYTFWLTARKGGELYLSDTGSKWGKEKAAETGRVDRGQIDDYDVFKDQRSKSYRLKAGDEMFVESLVPSYGWGEFSNVAWSYGSGQVNWTQYPGVKASQAATVKRFVAGNAIDGDFSERFSDQSVAQTNVAEGELNWWEVDLGEARPVDAIVLWNSEDRTRLSNVRLIALDDEGQEVWSGSDLKRGARIRVELSQILGELAMVRKVRIEMAGTNLLNKKALAVAEVEVLGPEVVDQAQYQPRQSVPLAVMASYRGEVDDADGDELRDGWEETYGFARGPQTDERYGPTADPDEDSLDNMTESRLGTDPFSPDVIVEELASGMLLERWTGMNYYEVEQTVDDVRFYGDPEERRRIESDLRHKIGGQRYATRVRAYIEAPVSGDYRFWVSGRNGVSLYLSEISGDKYWKQEIASISRAAGAGLGVGVDSPFSWDSFVSQQSDPIELEAGKRYYIEVLHQKGGHDSKGELAVAWAPPEGEREVIPAEFLREYRATADDVDDDYLPDAWELENGLDPEDNGAGDLARQGERGDFDGDGLTNRQEYLLGTAANAADSDGDGLSDYDEVTFYGTDPGVSNDLTATVVGTVDLAAHQATANWVELDGGLIADSFRGEITWDFTVPSDGWWVVELSARLRGDLRSEERFPVRIAVNDSELGLQQVRFRYSETTATNILTPYLRAGTHRLKLKLDNYVGRRTMQLLGIRVLKAGGLDVDRNGIADWLEKEGRAGNQLATHASTSLVSPAFIEGSTRYSNQVAIATAGGEVSARSGLGPQHWYANVPLLAEGATPIEVGFEQGQIVERTEIEWLAWDAGSGELPRLRAGDSLKLTLSQGGLIRIVSPSKSKTNYRLEPGEERSCTFSSKGAYTLVILPQGVKKRKIRLVASGATIKTRPGSFIADLKATVLFPEVTPDLVLNAGPALDILSQGRGKKNQLQAQLLARETGPLPIAVRLFENGPIVASGNLNAINYSDALQNDAQMFVRFTADGYRVLRTPIVVTGLPEGGWVRVLIKRNGVVFLDGTRTLTLYADDFTNGVAYLDFRYPPNMTGGYCHYVEIFDAAGNRVGKR